MQKRRDLDSSSWRRRELPSRKGRELKRRKELDLDQSRGKETKEKLESSQEETINQDRDKRTTMCLKKQEKQKLNQVSGKKELRHQQETQTLKNTSQDKVDIKTLRPRESRGSLPSPRDAKMLPKTPWPRLLSLQLRSFMALVVKWLFRPPPAREPSKGSESKWQKELRKKRLTKRSSDSQPSKRRKPKRRPPKSKSGLRLQREKTDKSKRRKKRLRRDEPKLKPKSLRRPPVLLSNKRPKTIRPEPKTKANFSTEFDKARKLNLTTNRTPSAKLAVESIKRRKTKKEARKTLLNQHQKWSTGLKHQPPKLRKLLQKLSKLRIRKVQRHHKVATNLIHQLRPRRKANHEEIERRSQPRPKRPRLMICFGKPWKPRRSKLEQLLPKLCHLNQLQNLTNLLLLKRKTPNMLQKQSTKSQENQSIKTPAKKLLPSSTNSLPRSTTSVDFKSSSPDKRRRLKTLTKRTTSSKSNSNSVLMKIN